MLYYRYVTWPKIRLYILEKILVLWILFYMIMCQISQGVYKNIWFTKTSLTLAKTIPRILTWNKYLKYWTRQYSNTCILIYILVVLIRFNKNFMSIWCCKKEHLKKSLEMLGSGIWSDFLFSRMHLLNFRKLKSSS